MSASVGVTCGICRQDIGDQFYPGDGYNLFVAHLAEFHPSVEVRDTKRGPVQTTD